MFTYRDRELYFKHKLIASVLYNEVIVYIGPAVYLTCGRDYCYIVSAISGERREYRFDSEDLFELCRWCCGEYNCTIKFKQGSEHYETCIRIYQSWKKLNDVYSIVMDQVFIYNYENSLSQFLHTVTRMKLVDNRLSFKFYDFLETHHLTVEVEGFPDNVHYDEQHYANLIASQILDSMMISRVPVKSARNSIFDTRN